MQLMPFSSLEPLLHCPRLLLATTGTFLATRAHSPCRRFLVSRRRGLPVPSLTLAAVNLLMCHLSPLTMPLCGLHATGWFVSVWLHRLPLIARRTRRGRSLGRLCVMSPVWRVFALRPTIVHQALQDTRIRAREMMPRMPRMPGSIIASGNRRQRGKKRHVDVHMYIAENTIR